MLSRVGRAGGLLCVFLFMPFSSNSLPKVTVRPPPGTELSLHNIRRSVQSRCRSGNGRAPSEHNSCREAAQSNQPMHGTPPRRVGSTSDIAGAGSVIFLVGLITTSCERQA